MTANTKSRDYGTRIVAGTGLLGAAVSLYNYFSEWSGISDTPGALLVVITSVALIALGFAIGALRSGGLRRALSVAALVLILGTAFAAYLLESPTLLALMVVCWIGWSVQALGPRRAAPAVALPAIYQYKDKQYVAFAAGGNSILTPRVSDEVVAFSLPD
jgi:glycerol-3-phosphate acyltransferase PlsY